MKTQEEIDKGRREMAEKIVADRNLTTLEEAKGFATEWIITAAQHLANEEYFRGERDALLERIKQVRG